MTLIDRSSFIGGSDAPAAVGVSPWRTPYQLWQEKTGEAEPQPDTPILAFGRMVEDFVRGEFSRLHGVQVLRPRTMHVHPKYAWMAGHLDGVISPRRIFEAKSARFRTGWGEEGSDDIPTQYLVQCLHYLEITGADVVDVAVLFSGCPPIHHYVVERDLAAIEALVEQEHAFWRKVETREPPAPLNPADCARRWSRSLEASIEATPDILRSLVSLTETKDAIKRLQEIEESTETKIKTFMEGNALLTYNSTILATWRTSRDGTQLDRDRLARELPDIVREYQITRPGSRRFLLRDIA